MRPGVDLIDRIIQLQLVPVKWYICDVSFGSKGHETAVLLQLTTIRVASTMTGRSAHLTDDRSIRRYSSSSISSESEVESSSDSDVSSDGLDLGLEGKSEAQQKFKRLRRIFLNRPPKSKTKDRNQQRRCSPKGRVKSREDREPSRASVGERHHSVDRRRGSVSSDASVTSDTRAVDRLTQPVKTGRPLQAAIDQHMNSLWEQMKRHSAQRDSSMSLWFVTSQHSDSNDLA